MGQLLKELFEKYAKRLLTNKVRPSISEEGIMTIPNKQRVEKMAQNLYEDFKKAGVPDNILKTENDIKVFHHKIAEINNENMVKQFDTLMSESTLFNPKKSADVFDLKGNKIKNPDNIMGGEEIIETEADILTRLNKGNKESLSNIRYENAVKAEEAKAAADEDYIMKVLDPEDFSKGGRAGYYGGGQAMVEPDLSDIGHGSDALMGRTRLTAPGSQATTSTGLNYLLGEDNDNVRVPFNEGLLVPPKKPYTKEMFQDDSMTLLQGMHGTGKDSNEFLYNEMIKKGNILRKQGVERETVIEIIKNNKDKIDMILKQQIGDKKSLAGLADGGRIGYNKGKAVKKVVNEGRRGFMKAEGAAGAGIAALKTGLLGFGKSVIAPATQAANEAAGKAFKGVPPYFLKLVEKIKNFGTDVTETGALAERQNVKQYKDFTLTEDTATGRIEIQKVKNAPGEEFGKDNFGNGLTEEVYMGYTPPETIVVKGKSIKTKPEYDEGTAYLRNDGPQTGEVYEEVSGVTEEVLKEVGEAVVKKADGGRIGFGKGDIVTKGGPALIKAGEGTFTKAQYLIERIKNTIKGNPKDKYIQDTFPGFIKELEVNPELAKNENVFKELGGDLPEDQKIVVYSDDTLDFFTTSSGPQNIQKVEKFMTKHGLSREKALEVMKMEPNDQVMELTKTKFIKNKQTDN